MLAGLGFRDFRVRMYHGGARLQVTEEQLALALEKAAGDCKRAERVVSGCYAGHGAAVLENEH